MHLVLVDLHILRLRSPANLPPSLQQPLVFFVFYNPLNGHSMLPKLAFTEENPVQNPSQWFTCLINSSSNPA